MTEENNCHNGKGIVRNSLVLNDDDFETNLRFIRYMELPPKTSIGYHEHGDDEELYIILEGQGVMNVDGEQKEVTMGDIITNKPFGSHGLINNSDNVIKMLVLEVYK
ncbi:hypothetical protein C8C77_103226 [Halanaerobium saccharolyticum]|uniref:Cupin type-2 domain-containing protein n=1 Tax=Halanaerobium saccharolyticum TaxID=43595 RepID=A0A4R7Z887_9FIRM|nr:hypothetical protein C7958_103226 [Halanaerobium saccharolyticum]TDW07089.1 hypothetical protein C8C77_103226 [Halanaerobium saccharolyticum]TDX63854.1 hypothetical protein C7956_102226 [Halanaerobium saccharolyticum]